MDIPSIPDIIAFLTSAEPDVLEQMGEGALLEAFTSAAAEVPAYQDMLKQRGVDPAAVGDIAAFRAAAPLLDKSLFAQYRVDQLCRRGSLKEVKAVIPSSGHSGVFAFNVETFENVKGGTTMADLAFEYCLKVSEKPTFLVNAYPMGLQVPTQLPSTNTGVNADVALAIIKTFGPHFAQLIVVSQPLFAKKLGGRSAGPTAAEAAPRGARRSSIGGYAPPRHRRCRAHAGDPPPEWSGRSPTRRTRN